MQSQIIISEVYPIKITLIKVSLFVQKHNLIFATSPLANSKLRIKKSKNAYRTN
jgi:hypothetical protein